MPAARQRGYLLGLLRHLLQQEPLDWSLSRTLPAPARHADPEAERLVKKATGNTGRSLSGPARHSPSPKHLPPARAAPARVPLPRSAQAGGLVHAGASPCRELERHVRLHGELLKAEKYREVAVF